ncbi:MAG: hypothetical protein H6765_02560 [Candidatus Peribacteria bacterium]|nr:MAG: hypothetical protein H6765_02560 [Candidatus Peribacteria bacterium]
MAQLFAIDFVIDTAKTSLPTELLFAEEYEFVKSASVEKDYEKRTPIYSFKKDVSYSFSEK